MSVLIYNQSLTKGYQSVIQSLSLILHPVQQPRLDVIGHKDGHDFMQGDGIYKFIYKSVTMSTVDDGTRLVVSTGFGKNKQIS